MNKRTDHSLIALTQNNMIQENNKDIAILKEEITILKNQITNYEESSSIYSQNNNFNILMAKLITIESQQNILENENKLINEAFTEGMIEDLDYILQLNKSPWPKTIANLVVNARIDIVRFEKSNISLKDYERDVKILEKKAKDIYAFLPISHKIIIPRRPHEIIQEMIFYLDEQICGLLLKRKYLSNEAIKDIVTVISDRKYLPRLQSRFNDTYHKYLFGVSQEELIRDFIRKPEDKIS